MKLALPAKSLQTEASDYIEQGFLARLLSRISRQFGAYLFLMPAIIIFGLVAWYPIARAFEMSFQYVNLIGESEWVGFDNYELMKLDPARKIIWKNTLQYLMWSITLGYAIPIICAILIREMRHGGDFFRIVYFLPTVVPISIAVIVWRFIYNPESGFLNELIGIFGIEPQLWLTDVKLAKPSLVLIMTWGGFGTTTLIYLAAILDIPSELYEAAELDGASPLHRIRHITLPHLFPVMSLMFVLQIIFVVQVFTEPYLLTKGNPARTTLTPVLHIYNKAFGGRADMGYAAAWSVTLLIFLAIFSAIHLYIDRRINRT